MGWEKGVELWGACEKRRVCGPYFFKKKECFLVLFFCVVSERVYRLFCSAQGGLLRGDKRVRAGAGAVVADRTFVLCKRASFFRVPCFLCFAERYTLPLTPGQNEEGKWG